MYRLIEWLNTAWLFIKHYWPVIVPVVVTLALALAAVTATATLQSCGCQGPTETPTPTVTVTPSPTPTITPTPTPVVECDVTVPTTTTSLNGGGLNAGDVVCVEAGQRGLLTLWGLHGEPDDPIVIVNDGGIVDVDAGGDWVGIYLQGCTSVRLTGTGTGSADEYGFRIHDADIGILAEPASYVAIDHVEVFDVGGLGIHVISKAENVPAGWVQQDTEVAYCYIHDVEHGEGMYVGGSFWPDDLELHGVEIHHNLLENIGWEAIQVGSATQGVEVHHNTIRGSGTTCGDASDGSAFCINPGTNGDWYANQIEDARYGFMMNGGDDVRIFNNVMRDVEWYGIRWFIGEPAELFNNTVIGAGIAGIEASSWMGVDSGRIHDNLLVDCAVGLLPIGVPVDHNLDLTFPETGIDPEGNLLAGSPAIDAGSGDCAAEDVHGVVRSGVCDVGAVEYVEDGR